MTIPTPRLGCQVALQNFVQNAKYPEIFENDQMPCNAIKFNIAQRRNLFVECRNITGGTMVIAVLKNPLGETDLTAPDSARFIVGNSEILPIREKLRVF